MIESLPNNWGKKFIELFESSKKVCIISPFISNNRFVKNYFIKHCNKQIKVITRANNEDFICKVSNVEIIEKLFDNKNTDVKLLDRGLHAKLYLFDKQVIISSSNLTSNGLNENLEYGVLTTDEKTVDEAKKYFEDLWSKGRIVNKKLIAEIKKNIKQEQEKLRKNKNIKFKDWGAKNKFKKTNAKNTNEKEERLYLVYFEESNHRSWDDAIEYGFISAGMGRKYSKDLDKLKPGDKVLVKYLKRIKGKPNKGFGYVAYGEVMKKVEMTKDVMIDNKKLSELSKPMDHHLNSEENSEWVVKVKWLTVPLSAESGIRKKGLYGLRGIVVKKLDLDNRKVLSTIKILRKNNLII